MRDELDLYCYMVIRAIQAFDSESAYWWASTLAHIAQLGRTDHE